jgi:AcrR family transcriptional regulator
MAEAVDAARLGTLPLRERKRALTREAILTAAGRLFEERGFDEVTVAEIADAANVSVKTLFVYFRSKEDLVFTDTWLLDRCLDALRQRPPGTSPGEAIAGALITVLRDGGQREDGQPDGGQRDGGQRDGGQRDGGQAVREGIEGFHRGYGSSAALHSRLLRMWEEYEDRITAALAAEAASSPTPAMRLEAIRLVGILRSLTYPEVRSAIAGLSSADSLAYVGDWLLAAGRS